MNAFNAQDSLVATMILTAAADTAMSAREAEVITASVGLLPAFAGLAAGRIDEISTIVVAMLQEESGVDQIIALVDEGLPGHLRETAYALACDVAAADGALAIEEMNLLELLRHRLGVDRLRAAAIERGARARFSPL